MGLWLVLFLMEHLLVNSQAALWLGDNGKGFVDLVNGIHNLPYLQVIEIALLGIPIAIHMVWGVKYLLTGKFNAQKSDGTTPSIALPRNRAYSWQRITSWILLFGIIAHVVNFRFLQYPDSVRMGSETLYLTTLGVDDGLYTLADRLNVNLYSQEEIAQQKADLGARKGEQTLVEAARNARTEQIDPVFGPVAEEYSCQKALIFNAAQKYEDQLAWVNALGDQPVTKVEVAAVSKDFGTAMLLKVRDEFKHPWIAALYTIFVAAACFHAFNGFWTFLLTWGLILKMSAQRAWTTVALALMLIIGFLGMAAIWGTYWINLRY
jgi:succinate dehydrogenase / fumarate reductase cytochrome b subunit